MNAPHRPLSIEERLQLIERESARLRAEVMERLVENNIACAHREEMEHQVAALETLLGVMDARLARLEACVVEVGSGGEEVARAVMHTQERVDALESGAPRCAQL